MPYGKLLMEYYDLSVIFKNGLGIVIIAELHNRVKILSRLCNSS